MLERAGKKQDEKKNVEYKKVTEKAIKAIIANGIKHHLPMNETEATQMETYLVLSFGIEMKPMNQFWKFLRKLFELLF